MTSGIYIIELADKIYIGSTENTYKRFNEHKNDLKKGVHHCKQLQRTYNKYDYTTVEPKLILVCAPEHLLFYEQRLLDVYYGQPNCMNDSKNATAPMKGRKHTDIAKAKIGAASKNRNHGPRGPQTKERIENRVAKIRGKKYGPLSDERKKNISIALTGKRDSEETKAIKSDAAKRRWARVIGEIL